MSIDWLCVLNWTAIIGAGFLAGGINVVVGAGTLVSFPFLVLLGVPPLNAAIANTIGIVPGSVAGVVVFRRELHARISTIRILLPASAAGGILGTSLLLYFSAETFTAVIPWLIGTGTILVMAGPTIKRRVGHRSQEALKESCPTNLYGPFPSRTTLVLSVIGAFFIGIYGGYFSAAQGILLIALLAITSSLHMQELNAIKNFSVAIVNIIAAIVFIVVSPEMIAWSTVGLIAFGSTLGGVVGGRLARRLRPGVFRVFVAIVGIVTITVMTVNL